MVIKRLPNTTPTSLQLHKKRIHQDMSFCKGSKASRFTIVPARRISRMEKVVKRLRISDIWKNSNCNLRSLINFATHFVKSFFLFLCTWEVKLRKTWRRAVVAWKYKTWMIVCALENFRFSACGKSAFLHWKRTTKEKSFSFLSVFILEEVFKIIFELLRNWEEMLIETLRLSYIELCVKLRNLYSSISFNFKDNVGKKYLIIKPSLIAMRAELNRLKILAENFSRRE